MIDYIKPKKVEGIKLLNDYLNSKPLFYNEIDITRMPRAYDSIKEFLPNKKVIHIIGTNGKGSTGRFLAYYLYKLGYSVGHYTSPHIIKFNERIWINNKNIDDESLEKCHENLQILLNEEFLNTLSYFEYTTLLAMVCFNKCDYIILEAGLGGEFDATNVFDKEITLITPIDYDHQNFLGNNIKDITQTKLNAINKQAIISKQKHKKVYEIALSMDKEIKLYDFYLNENEKKDIKKFIKNNNFASYLENNLSLAMSYIKYKNLEFDLKFLDGIKLFGRLQKIDKNLYIDVGHNPLAANAIKKEFKNKKINLIYNTYKDKDYEKILNILKPIIDTLYIIEVDNERIEDSKNIKKVAKKLGIKVKNFKELDLSKINLVFGSFSVVEEFLKRFDYELL